MKEYYGTKRIAAEPDDLSNGEPGYALVYPDGYASWSPKAVFEASYRESGRMNFGHALAALKEGRKVAREEWKNQEETWLGKISHVSIHKREVTQEDHLFLKMSGRELEAEWSPEEADVLAEDWRIVE
jgi:hypothetical protein